MFQLAGVDPLNLTDVGVHSTRVSRIAAAKVAINSEMTKQLTKFTTMQLYIVQFYDANESGNVEHNEVYTSLRAAERRYNALRNKLDCYSWVSLCEGVSKFGRVRRGRCICSCSSCNGKDDYYHGDDSDF